MNTDILRRRAEQLAVRLETQSVRTVDFMVFEVGAERYAVPLEMVRGVVQDAVTPMPGAAAWIAGALNVRGTLVSVLELTKALNLSLTGETAHADSVLLLESEFGVIGVRVHGMPELRAIPEREIVERVPPRAGVRGVALGTIALLDLEALLEALE
jgi:purine-binding chemotaxis protein CheW